MRLALLLLCLLPLSSEAAITLVQQSTGTNCNPQAIVATCTLPGAMTIHNAAVLWLGYTTASTPTVKHILGGCNVAWVSAGVRSATQRIVDIWWCPDVAAVSSIIVYYDNVPSSVHGNISEWSGGLCSLDGAGGTATAASGAPTVSATTTQNVDLVVAGTRVASAAGFTTMSNGFTLLTTDSTVGDVGYLVTSSSGSQSTVFQGMNTAYDANMAAFSTASCPSASSKVAGPSTLAGPSAVH